MNDVDTILAELKRLGTKKGRDGMARYAIVAPRAFGVSVGQLKAVAKPYGKNHPLALALWDTGWYEARMMTAFVDDPALVTPAQMDRWTNDFDNWAVCDSTCFHVFDKTPHAFPKITQWAKKRGEFQRRAAFVLLASVALHDRKAPDEKFLDALDLVDKASTDERNFVRKSVVWALRSIGGRNRALNAASLSLAKQLAASDDKTARSTGKEVIRELAKPAATRRLESRSRAKA
jgi:3-methyladenine DNA glycosylase AlkD